MPLEPVTTEQRQEVLEWLNKLDLPKHSTFIHRDFADATLLARLIKLYLPNLVELHNYQSAVGVPKKLENWTTLNAKVLKKLDIRVTNKDLQELASAKPGMIEALLYKLRQRFDDMARSSAGPAPEEQPNDRPLKPMKEVSYNIYDELVEVSNVQPGKSGKPAGDTQGCEQCAEKDEQIADLQAEVELLEEKVDKLQQLVRLKDGKNKALMQQVEQLQQRLGEFE